MSFDKTVVSTVAYAWASGNNKARGKPGVRRVSDGETKESVDGCLATQWRDVCLTLASDTSSAPDLGLEHSARQVHRDMLEFAAVHGIKPVKMTFPLNLEGVKDSLKTLEDGKMRYRGVLVAGK